MKKTLLIFSALSIFLAVWAEWSVVETFQIPQNASGLAFDGSNLYCGIYGPNGENIYQINPENGEYSLLFTGTHEDSYGLSAGSNSLWLIDQRDTYDPAVAVEYDMEGNILAEIELPAHYMSGIAFDNGNLWCSSYYDPEGYIYKIDQSGEIIQEFDIPNEQPWDLCLQDNFIWVIDYYANEIYKYDSNTGNLESTYGAEFEDAAGIVFDGNHLWYTDEGTGEFSNLYKIDLEGNGNSEISLEFDSYEFANTLVQETSTTELEIFNNGAEELVIDFYNFDSDFFSSSIELPITIQPNESFNLPIYFSPNTWGSFESTLTISSNDPLNPEVVVDLEGYGLESGEFPVVDLESIDYEDVRINALTGRFLEISNQGNEEWIFGDYLFDTDNFYFDSNLELPITLATRDTLQLRIWFSADETGEFSDELLIDYIDNDDIYLSINLTADVIDFAESFGTQFWYFNSNDESEKIVAMHSFQDLTNDDVPEILIADNNYNIHCVNGNSSGEADILWTFKTNIPEIGFGSIYDKRSLITAGDLNNDGIDDVAIGTAWGSRSIFAVNGLNGEELWHYDTDEYGEGGWVYQVNADEDFNFDGVNDILAATGDDANGNGPKGIFLFNGATGEIIWEQHFAESQTAVITIGTIDYDGTDEVICASSGENSTTKIRRINSMGTSYAEYSFDDSAVWALAEINDLNDDGPTDFIAGGFYAGVVKAFNYEFDNFWQNTSGSGLVTRFEIAEYEETQYVVPVVAGNYTRLIEVQSGETEYGISSDGNSLDIALTQDLNGDNHFDVVLGTLNNKLQVFSGNNGTELNEKSYSSPLDNVLDQTDLDNNNCAELIVGLRNGYVECISGKSGNVAAENSEDIAQIFTNVKNYPNPFILKNSRNSLKTVISFNLRSSSKVNVSIYNIKGQKVKELVNTYLDRGFHEIPWEGRNKNKKKVASGVYFYKIENSEDTKLGKLLLIK